MRLLSGAGAVVAALKVYRGEKPLRGIWLALAALHGLIAVAAGAFGAHALKGRLAPEHLAIFDTGARYQMYHALALLAVAAHLDGRARRLLFAGIACMHVGVVLFSGSLYALALTHGDWRWLGPVTPIGGAMLIVGWFLIFLDGVRSIAATRGRTATRKDAVGGDDVAR